MVEYLEAHGGLPEDFFAGLPLSRAEYEGVSGDGWVAREPFDALWRRVHWATGDEDIAYKIGLWAVRNRSFGALGFFARALGDPAAILGRAVERLASLDTLAEHRVAELGSRAIRIEHRYAAGAPPSRDFCFLLRGALAAAPTLWGRSPGSVVESQCAAPIDRLGALMGRTFRVDERGRVWQQDERGEQPPIVLGEVAPDGSFRFGDTVYGAPACIHELRWEAPRPGYAWIFDLLFRRRRFALEAFEEHERAKRELESRARELERHAMELERQGRALRQSEELYRGLFAQNSDGIFLVSPRTSEIEKANRAAQKLVGHKEDELRGRRLFELFPSSEWQRVRETFERAVLRGEARADAVTLRQASEEETVVEL
ncbi:MAG: PAS domain S-box protein, partial [Candidatus Methylomirabilis sp.]|nr:PAS domain S-box protein [Deltaproteobacteria bacterium]